MRSMTQAARNLPTLIRSIVARISGDPLAHRQRTNFRLLRRIVFSALLVTGGIAHADVIYTYTGNEFLYIGGCCGVSNLSGSFTLPSALAPNTTYDNLASTVSSYSFSDGRNT